MDDAQELSSNSHNAGGLKKVFTRSNRSLTTQVQDAESTQGSARSNGRSSVDSTPDKRPATAGGELTVEDSPKRLSKLLSSRRKKKNNNNNNNNNNKPAEPTPSANSLDGDDDEAGPFPPLPSEEFQPSDTAGSTPSAISVNLLTDDSETDRTPPLIPRDSHTGYLTTSSPLIKTTPVDDTEDTRSASSRSPSRRHSISAPEASSPGHLGFTATVSGPPSDSSRKQSVSPGRRLKDAFKPQSKKSPGVSPDRESSQSSESHGRKPQSIFGGSSRRSSLSERRAGKRSQSPPPPLPKPIVVDSAPPPKPQSPASTNSVKTPTARDVARVVTTVTPPTPTDSSNGFAPQLTDSPESIKSKGQEFPPGTVVSPSGNMISHRRVRSAEAVSHPPSKLSQSTILTPTIEENRAMGPRSPSGAQNGFFSSVLSAAQNAASSLSGSLGGPNKNRSVTSPTDVDKDQNSTDAIAEGEKEALVDPASQDTSEDAKKELAVNTLGTGDLDFSHLDVDSAAGGVVTTKDGVVITKPDLPADNQNSTTAAKRDQMSARIEDLRAARAVSMAYEKSSELAPNPTLPTPEEGGEQRSNGLPLTKETSGEQTPPGGSTIEGETPGNLRRTGSVRSRLARRHRRSSGATGSTIGAIGLNAVSLGMPNGNSSAPRLTGFAVASKKRNREYHQLFRSVPEDDFLIEDYSCALQRDIILAGRIYISEGHICFSSNILGFVTTLVISFDEIVAIEKENTAMVFPNAIAIQTLHSRHTFRSLLSREATYDLMVNIWKINHPSLRSYLNGMRIDEGLGDKTEKANESDVASELEDEDEIYDEDEDNEDDSSDDGGEDSIIENKPAESGKQVSRKASGLVTNSQGSASAPALATLDAGGADNAGSSEGDVNGFPGPATHAPTEYNDAGGRYDKVVKEDIVPAPLGKVYSLVFGPASGAFISQFLVEDQKSLELQFEDDKKGLNNAKKSRQYSYIKPLNAPIGPKQTKCISSETLDLLDLEKAVLVTVATQTPDVPSGNIFTVKTKYLFTWAPNNQTKFLMSCTIEWSGKSWLKGPIEKGAIDGQTGFGNDLVKSLKTVVQSRGAKGAKTKGRRKKGVADAGETVAVAAAAASAALDANKRDHQGWGVLEPLRGPLQPVVSLLKPLWSAQVAIGIIAFLLFTIYSKGLTAPTVISSDMTRLKLTPPQRLAAYEEMWRAEENELWKWLEDRVGLDGISFPASGQNHNSKLRPQKHSQKAFSQYLASKIDDEQISQREMSYAIGVVRDRLEKLEQVVGKPSGPVHAAGSPIDETQKPLV
ncbi:putative membrane protein C20F10,07 [Talaromyces islandicus]|uniref:Putative membrane protein C20F10,07 n=1 Tax=Talaromyces islandicus TaxID=28573 RepID=A0A0U1LVL5_TALIS|nr:putative membrane protein C20F10,07 [Talaromyces islandicus]